MKKMLLLGMAIALASAAWSMPTILGPNGAFALPTAEVQQGVSLSIDTLDAISFAFKYPFTKVVAGVNENIEVGAGYVAISEIGPSIDAWNVFGKIVLPFEVAQGKIAAGAMYISGDEGFDGWMGSVTGTWPVFSNASFTAGAIFSSIEEDEQTSFGAALEMPYENMTVGIEWLWNLWDLDFGTIYTKIPINDRFTGRVALTGLGQATIVDLGAEMKF